MSDSEVGATSTEFDPAYVAGHHSVSPFNYDPEAQVGCAFPRPLVVFDSTVRKILLTPGLRPTVEDVLFISEALESVGIREVFLNIHWWGDATPDELDYEACRAMLSRDFAFRTTVYAESFLATPSYSGKVFSFPARQAVDMIREIGVSTMQVQVRNPKNEGDVARLIERVEDLFSHAKASGMSCTLGMPDVARADFAGVVRLANEGIRFGAVRIDLLDSASSLSPEAMKVFVSRFRASLAAAVPVTMHVHNDFGLGTAMVIAAASAGAHPDVSVNGISYRTGFAALEEVAASLEILYGVPTGLRLEMLPRLCEIVAQRTGLPIPPLKPIVGSHAFVRDTVKAMVQYFRTGPDGFPPPGSCVAPSVFGGRLRVVWGNHYSNTAIRAKLGSLHLDATDRQVVEIRSLIRSRVESLDSYPYWLGDDEVEAICRSVLG